MKRFGIYLLGDNRRSALIALVCALLPFFLVPTGFFAPIIVGLVTLRKGIKAGLMVLAFILLPEVSLLIAKQFMLVQEYSILTVQCGLVFVSALLVRHTQSFPPVAAFLTLFGMGVVVLIHLLFPNVQHLWFKWYQQYLPPVRWLQIFHVSAGQAQMFIERLVHVATGLIFFIFAFGVFIQLMLARWWESNVGGTAVFQEEFSTLRVPFWVILVVGGITGGLYWHPVWLVDLYPLAFFPFMLAGLSFLHYLVGQKKERSFFLVLVYLALLLLTFVPAILLAILGFLDSCFDFRKRYPHKI